MDSQNSPMDHSSPSPYRTITIIAMLIIGAQILLSLLSYPFLPAVVPTHWNINGQANSYAPKWLNAVLFPLISLAIFGLLRFLLALGPNLNLNSEGKRANLQIVNIIIVWLLLFFLVIHAVVTTISFGVPVDITFVMNISLAVLMILLGNYLGKLRRNFWAGIRTPWTLASETVWERTHRLGGWLFVAAGLFALVTSFVPVLRFWGSVGALSLVAVVLVIYSYIVYQRLETNDRESLSPPFDQN